MDGPGKWNNPHLNQGPLLFKQTNQKGHLWKDLSSGFNRRRGFGSPPTGSRGPGDGSQGAGPSRPCAGQAQRLLDFTQFRPT